MAFEIKFVGDEFEDKGVRLHCLLLSIGDFAEEMYADVTNWSTTDYERQWLAQLNALIQRQRRGALLTSLHDPKVGYRIEAWPMWRENDVVYFQNRIIGMLEIEPRFDPDRLSELIGERREEDEEGRTISQWQIPISEIRDFLNREVFA